MTENENVIDVEDMNDAGNGDDFGIDIDQTEDGDSVHHGEIVTAEDADKALALNGGVDAFYASLDIGDNSKATLRNIAADAKSKMLDVRDNALEAGRMLIEAQGIIGHGKFLRWLKAEFGQSDRTARNFMSFAITVDTAANLFGASGADAVLALPQKVAYSIGADNLPEEAKAEIITRIVNGELDDPKEMREAITDAKEEANQRRQASKSATGKASGDSEEGDGEGEGETLAEKKKKRAAALRKLSAFNLAVGLVSVGEEDDAAVLSAADVMAAYGEIGSGSKGKMTAEDHAMLSEMVFKVAMAYGKGGRDAVERLKPAIPDEPVAKTKRGKKTEADDPAE